MQACKGYQPFPMQDKAALFWVTLCLAKTVRCKVVQLYSHLLHWYCLHIVH